MKECVNGAISGALIGGLVGGWDGAATGTLVDGGVGLMADSADDKKIRQEQKERELRMMEKARHLVKVILSLMTS